MYPVFRFIIRIAGLGSVFPLQIIIEEVILKHVKHMWWMISKYPAVNISYTYTPNQREHNWSKLHWDDD